MQRALALYQSSLGKKVVVAITGLVLYGFVLGHMLGNLKVFTGNDAAGEPHIDIYAHFLRTMGEPLVPYSFLLWIARVILIVSLGLHVYTVIILARQNHAARKNDYAKHNYSQASNTARWMMVSGTLLLLFVIFHLAQFTFGSVGGAKFVEGEVYANLYYAFQRWFFAVIYVAVMGGLALHVHHGVWSLFQTLGLDNPDRNRAFRLLATLSSIGLFIGFAAVPVLFYFGMMPLPPSIESTQLAEGVMQ
jgi:succinate dehydrogenase / fumarate reductase cytochrome b subunit